MNSLRPKIPVPAKTQADAVAASLEMSRRAMTTVADELRIRRAIEEAMKERNHEIDVIMPELGALGEKNPFERLSSTILTNPSTNSFRTVLVAQCTKCGQLVVGWMNPFPKPLLFGRKDWTEVTLDGGAYVLWCSYAQRQAWAVARERIRSVMES